MGKNKSKRKLVAIMFSLLVFSVFTLTIILQVNEGNISQNIVVSKHTISKVYATPQIPTELGIEIENETYGISDSNLYNKLLQIYNITFSSEPDFEPLTKVYENMFETFEELDLSNNLIYSLSGFSILNLQNLKHLNLSKNRLTNIDSAISSLNSLVTLNVFDNNLATLNVSTLSNLTELNANNNLLTKVNVSNITSGVVRIGFNKLTDTRNITLSQNITNLTLDVVGNNIINVENLLNIENLKLNAGVQGLGFIFKENTPANQQVNKNIQTTDTKLFVNMPDYENIVLRIYNYETNQLVLQLDSENNETVAQINLPVGNYYAQYENKITSQSAYISTDAIYSIFKPIDSIKIRPSKAKIEYYLNDKQINDYGTRIPLNTTVKFISNDENATVFYKVNNGEFVLGNEFTLSERGQVYSITVKTVINGFESDEAYVVLRTQGSQSFISAELIIVLVVVLGASCAIFIPALINKLKK